MTEIVNIIKGVHPGLYLDRELKKIGLPKGRLAIQVGEYPQTLGAITKGKRNMKPALALRIEKALGMEEGLLTILQAYFEIEREKKKLRAEIKPNIEKFRKVLFWDTDINRIDWVKEKRAVIERVFKRGDESEKSEIRSLYGEDEIQKVINKI